MASQIQPEAGLLRWLAVGFVGHRHLEHVDVVSRGIRRVLDRLAQRNPRLVGISSAASGADILFAEEMLRRRYPIRIVLPFPSCRFKEDFVDDPEAWVRSQAIIRAAEELDVVQQRDVEDDSVEPPEANEQKDRQRSETSRTSAYMEAGIRTADRCDVLIAVWDERPARGVGGTGDVVTYGAAIRRPMILIHPATGTITEQSG